jgi:hypothetical protein
MSEKINNTLGKPEDIILERMKVGIHDWITDELSVQAHPNFWYDHIYRRMCLSIVAYVTSEKLQSTTQTVRISLTFTHPDGPWQTFKDKYFPIWLRNIFPVRMKDDVKTGEKDVTFERYAIYPKLPLAWPKSSEAFHVLHETYSESDTRVKE